MKLKKRGNKKKMIAAVLTAISLYLFLGMLLPFVSYRKVDEAFIRQFSVEDFYGTTVSSDRAMIVEDNVTALDLRIRMINEARESIILSTFDMREGESSLDMAGALLAAADRGVDIKIMVDGISGMLRMEGNPFFYAISSYPNIEIRLYNKPNPWKPWTFNGRMHDKYLITDDVCFLLGGRNTFDYFLGDYETNSRSYDREVLLYNGAHGTGESGQSTVGQLVSYFNTVWTAGDCRTFHSDSKLQQRENVKEQVNRMRQRLELLRKEKPQLFSPTEGYEEMTVPIRKATLVSNPIHILGKEPLVFYQLTELLKQAKERAVIHTPYVVMNQDMCRQMESISSQVEDFSMVINSVDNGDNFVASADYLLHKKEVVETGVTLYEFDGGESTHGKSMLVDDNISVIGSYNLDLRSTYVDTELMLVVDSPQLNQILSGYMDVFQRDTRKVIDEKTYEIPEHLDVQDSPWLKKALLALAGPLLQLVRCLI